MWKPGAARPRKEESSRSSFVTDNGRSRSEIRRRGSPFNEEQRSLNGNDKGNSSDKNARSKSAPPQRPKKLSGTTMNMRFMQRKREQQQQKNTRRPDSGGAAPRRGGNQHQPMEIDNNDDAFNSSCSNAKESLGRNPQHQTLGGVDTDTDSVVDATAAAASFSVNRATPSDMYGVKSDVLGRRSFGGFNRAIQDAWNLSHREATSKYSDRRRKQQAISDEELLKRYEDFVNSANRDDSHHRQKKKKHNSNKSSRTTPNSNSSNKRKKKPKLVSSARKRGKLDDVLQSAS